MLNVLASVTNAHHHSYWLKTHAKKPRVSFFRKHPGNCSNPPFINIYRSAWWFQTCFIFHFIYRMSSETHWWSPSFFKMVESPPTRYLTIINHHQPPFTTIILDDFPSSKLQPFWLGICQPPPRFMWGSPKGSWICVNDPTARQRDATLPRRGTGHFLTGNIHEISMT